MIFSVFGLIKTALTIINSILTLAREQFLVNLGRKEAYLEVAKETQATISTAKDASDKAMKAHVSIDTDEAFDQEFIRSEHSERKAEGQ